MDRIDLTNRIKILEKLLEPQKKVICSFCNREESLGIVTNLTGATVCPFCVYRMLIATDTIPVGSIYCFKCKYIDGFKVKYKSTSVEWIGSGLDRYEEVIYQVKSASRSWEPSMVPERLYCGNCNAKLYKWYLEVNKYVKASFPEERTKTG